jgi:uncharacterized protein (TIGR00106 family)
MLVELTINPLGEGSHIGSELADILGLVDASGLPYQLTPTGTCIEGEWEPVMNLVRDCHERAREGSQHVITTITIEDEAGAINKLTTNVATLEQKLGRPLKRTPLLE